MLMPPNPFKSMSDPQTLYLQRLRVGIPIERPHGRRGRDEDLLAAFPEEVKQKVGLAPVKR